MLRKGITGGVFFDTETEGASSLVLVEAHFSRCLYPRCSEDYYQE